MTTEQFLWVEKYRPRTIDSCILPDHIKTTAKSFIAQGDLPNLLLEGGPGTGKTTLAMAMCRELGIVPLFINGSEGAEESGIAAIRGKIKDFASALSFDGKRKYVVLDEADYLNHAHVQPALRSMMEEFSINCGFALTCNYSSRIIPALHSRCARISFAIPPEEKKHLMVQTLTNLQSMLANESVRASEEILIQVIKRWWPDLRRMINEIQRACVNGELTPAVLGLQADVQFEPLWKSLKARKYADARTWVGQYADIEPPKFYRAVFDWLHENVEENSLPSLIVLTADYQYKHMNALDPHVHLAAFCLELMHNGQFK